MTRILVVDDSEDLQETYELLLTGEGYDVYRADDGAAGLRSVEKLHPDVVMLDMMIPGIDGLSFLRRMPQECHAPLPVVIATSGFDAFADEALARGAHAFLQKPVELDVLIATIRAALVGAPVAGDVIERNHDDAIAARQRAEDATAELVSELPPEMLRAFRGRLRALADWLHRYYGFGATFIQLSRERDLCTEATAGAQPPWVEGARSPRAGTFCNEVMVAGSTLMLADPAHHTLRHFSEHPELQAGWRFYAGARARGAGQPRRPR
jgi:CheY-like chemotaxis protein